MRVWQLLGLVLLLYGADHLVLITILNLEQVDLSTRLIQGCFGLAAWASLSSVLSARANIKL